MFGIDDLIGGLVGGGLKMLANTQQAQYAQDAAFQQQQWTQQNMGQSQQFNAEQADIARQFSARQQNQAMDFNAQQSEINRQFQERMSSTAYQRARADMLAAGLNPILMAGQGGAASTPGSSASVGAVGGPSASVGTVSGASVPDRPGLLAGAVSSAGELMRLKPTLDNLRADTGVKDESQQNISSQTAHNRALIARTREETNTERERAENVRTQTEDLRSQITNREREQSRIHMLGSGFNPAYWADKINAITVRPLGTSAGTQQGVQSAGDAARELSSSAKSFQRMYQGE